MPLLIWMSQNSSYSQPIGCRGRQFLIHTGALASCWAATAPLSSVGWIRLYQCMYLHIHLPAFIDNIHGWQVTTSRFRLHLSLLFSWWVDAVVNHTREHACQYKEHVNTQGIHRSREQGCAKPGSMIQYIHTYIHTHNYSAHGGHCHDQCGARSGLPQ